MNIDELDNFDKHDGNPIYDMVVDYDYHINTGTLVSECGDTDLDT